MLPNDDIRSQLIPIYDAVDLGRAIRRLRRARGWTQSDLAEWLGVHRVTVAKLERGGAVELPIAFRALAVLGAMASVHPRGLSIALKPTDG